MAWLKVVEYVPIISRGCFNLESLVFGWTIKCLRLDELSWAEIWYKILACTISGYKLRIIIFIIFNTSVLEANDYGLFPVGHRDFFLTSHFATVLKGYMYLFTQTYWVYRWSNLLRWFIRSLISSKYNTTIRWKIFVAVVLRKHNY